MLMSASIYAFQYDEYQSVSLYKSILVYQPSDMLAMV